MSATAKGGGAHLSGTPVGAVMSMENLQKAAQSISLSSTKSAKTIKEVVPLKDYLAALEAVKTRSADAGETLPVENVYVVNYENDEGYAILSADTRTDMVLAYSDEGNMNAERLENPAFREYVELIPVYMGAATASLDSEDMGYYGPVERAYIVEETLSYQSPLLTCTHWDQGTPFNEWTPVCPQTGEHMPLGCVPTALLQIMRYWQYPVSYNSRSLGGTFSPMWSSYESTGGTWTSETAAKNVARLAYDVATLCEVSYGCDGSLANIKDADYALRAMGYATNGVYSFHIDRITEDIRNGQPIYMCGSSSSGGHAWVMDGEQWFKWKYDVYLTQYNTDGSIQWQEYLRSYYDDGVNLMFHVNWGWGPYYNTDYTNPNVYELAGVRYNQKLEVIKNIRPR